MDNINFLFFDDLNSKKVINNDGNLKVLVQNEDRTFRLDALPYNIKGTFKEFQQQVGPIVYVIDKDNDSKLINEYGSTIMNHLEKIDEDSYHVVAGYDKKNICVKGTDIAKPTNEPSLRFVRIDRVDIKQNCKEIFALRENEDDTVSITPSPISIRESISQYEEANNCLLVVAIGEKDLYHDDDIIQLEKNGDECRYSFIKKYEKPKEKVKK